MCPLMTSEVFPSWKEGRAVPSVTLVVTVAHKCDAEDTEKTSKSNKDYRAPHWCILSAMVFPSSRNQPTGAHFQVNTFPSLQMDSGWGILNPCRQWQPNSVQLRSWSSCLDRERLPWR